MDHLEDKFDIYIETSFKDFYREWTTGKYTKYSECPSYNELKTLIDSCNILRKYLGYQLLSIKEMISDRE